LAIGGARAARALLVRLALDTGPDSVRTDALLDAVLGATILPAGAANALQTLVSRLRRVAAARRAPPVTRPATGSSPRSTFTEFEQAHPCCP